MLRSTTARFFALALAVAAPSFVSLQAAHADAPAAAAAAGSTWNIDDSHTTVSFAVRHMGISNVYGQFGKVSGTITWDGKDTSTLKADVTVDIASVDTRNEKRDGHLKSPDFFDVAKFPTATFKSKSATKADGGKFKLVGDLTLHGVTKEVTLDVDAPSPAIKDPFGFLRTATRATARVNRKDFGLTWNKVLETGGLLVGEDIGLTFDLEAVQKLPETAAAKK